VGLVREVEMKLIKCQSCGAPLEFNKCGHCGAFHHGKTVFPKGLIGPSSSGNLSYDLYVGDTNTGNVFYDMAVVRPEWVVKLK